MSDKPDLTDDEIFEIERNVLKSQMPRLFKQFELLWGYPKEFDKWISTLWIDDRGDRQGFPPDVMSALIRLSNLHTKKFGSFEKTDAWSVNRKFF